MQIIHAALSHVGLKRLENQDRFAILPMPGSFSPSASFRDDWRLLAVADGMGGEAAGGLAAQTAMDELEFLDQQTLCDQEPTLTLLHWVKRTNGVLLTMGGSIPGLEGMGATFTAAALCKGKAHWVHVGDTRLYLFRARKLRRLTRDHRFLQTLLDEGAIDAAEAAVHPFRNRLDQCLGCPDIKPDFGAFDTRPGDIVLICSDGLHDEVSPESIALILDALPAHPREPDLEDTAQALVQAALAAGGRDNVTVVLGCVQA